MIKIYANQKKLKEVRIMNKKKKAFRIIFLILMAAAILAFLMSCGSDPADDGSGSAPADVRGGADEPPADQNGGQSEKSEFEPADVTYDGFEFKFLNFISYGDDWAVFRYNEVQPESLTSDPINDEIFNRNMIVESLYDIKITQVLLGTSERTDREGAETRAIQHIMTGTAEFDAGFFTGNGLPRLIGERELTYNLLAIPELDLTKSWWNQNCVRDFTLAGKLSAVTGDITIWNIFAPMVFYFNKELIEEYDLECPYQLVREGSWTWDKLGQL
jgi:hypothetical protein